MEAIQTAARADRKYRCYNCGQEFRVFKILPQHVKRGAQDPDEYTLNRHLADNPRCSEAIRAYDRTGNPDHLDNPPGLGRPHDPPRLGRLAAVLSGGIGLVAVVNRRMTAAERRRQGERSRAAWAAGKFAKRKPMRHARAWSTAEDALLRREAGQRTIAELTVAVSTLGMQRTEVAVRIRLKRLGLPCGVYSGLTARQVGALFGVDAKTITHSWVARGWLEGVRTGSLSGASWIFRDEHLEAFIRGYGHAFDWRLMRSGRWRSLAEILDRADPWLTVEQAAAALRVKASTLLNHCTRGWVRSERRFAQSGSPSGRIVLRRSWLADFRYRRPDLVGICGRRAAA